MMVMMGQHAWLRAMLLGLMVVTGWPLGAWAHEGPEITVKPRTVAAGGAIVVSGEALTPNGGITITLEGANFSATLGTVHSDAEGAFQQSVPVAPNAPPGLYSVKAIGEDGKSAAFEITIVAAREEAAPAQTGQSEAEASAAEHELQRPQSATQLIGISVVLVLSTLLGLTLVIRRK